MENLLNSFEVNMLLVDNAGYILFANQPLLRDYTFSLQDVQGKKYSEVFNIIEVEFEKIFEHSINKRISYMIGGDKNHVEIIDVTEVEWEAVKYYILQLMPLDEVGDKKSEKYKTESISYGGVPKEIIIFLTAMMDATKEEKEKIIPKYSQSVLTILGCRSIHYLSYNEVIGRAHLEWQVGSIHKDVLEKDYMSHIGTYPVLKNKKLIGLILTTYTEENLDLTQITQQMTQITGYIAERSEAKILQDKIAELKEKNYLTEKELRCFVDLSVDFAHEFKSPLNIIMSGMQLIQQEIAIIEVSNKQLLHIPKYIEMIKYNTHRLIQLVDDMMDKYAIEGGNMQLRMEEVDIIHIIEKTCMEHVEYIKTRGLELVFDTEVEELVFVCDKEKIERIVTNILSNAWKYSKEKGFIAVSIKLTEEGIVLYIEDNGIGIPEDMVENIFKRYVTVEENEPKHDKSSGIGLSIVKTLVELHKGRIWVESKKDKGTRVCIALPNNKEVSIE